MNLSTEWNAVQREATLAAELVATGITALGRANHAQTGYYYQAFFGLSIGLERMGKLIFVADYAIRNDGQFPDNQGLKQIGHDINKLIPMCAKVGATLDCNRRYAHEPVDEVHLAIEDVLSRFAEGARYFNLNLISEDQRGGLDPISDWWARVVEPILRRHYTSGLRARDVAKCADITGLMAPNTFVFHHDESGNGISDLETMMIRDREAGYAQRWGRMYTLQIVRWLASIISELALTGGYICRIQSLLGVHEPFWIFMNDDGYLRGRRTWSIYRP